MKNYTSQDLHLEEETEQEFRKIFPDKPLGEIYAIHYIISRINLCSFMYIPDPDKKYFPHSESYKDYLRHYEEIKPNLTEEIIEAICEYDAVGEDVINLGSKGYNLSKIFNYPSLSTEEAYFEYEESPFVQPFSMLDLVTAQFGQSVLPYLCSPIQEEK